MRFLDVGLGVSRFRLLSKVSSFARLPLFATNQPPTWYYHYSRGADVLLNDRLVGDLNPVGLGAMMMAAIMKATPVEKKSQNRRHLQASTYQMNSLMCHF